MSMETSFSSTGGVINKEAAAESTRAYSAIWPTSSMALPLISNPIIHEEVDQEQLFCNLKRLDGGVYMLTFVGDSQHWFTPDAIEAIDNFLDQVARDASARALLTTNQGKFFSNGMDVNYLRKTKERGAKDYLLMFQKLVSKILTFCLPTIAIIRGHAVGAGCIFALAHDYLIMSSVRGYIFMNEVNLGMSLTPGNVAVLRAKLPVSTFNEAILTGKRYNGESARTAGIVHSAGPTDTNLLKEAISKAMEYKAGNWNRDAYHALKMEMFKSAIKELKNGGVGYARM